MIPTPSDHSGRVAWPAREPAARHEWLLLGAVLLVVGLFGFWGRYDARQAIDAEQRRLLDVQAVGIEENLSSQLVGARAVLRGVCSDIEAAAGGRCRAAQRLMTASDVPR